MRTCLLLFCLLLGACVSPIVNKDVGVVEITYSQALQGLNSKRRCSSALGRDYY